MASTCDSVDDLTLPPGLEGYDRASQSWTWPWNVTIIGPPAGARWCEHAGQGEAS